MPPPSVNINVSGRPFALIDLGAPMNQEFQTIYNEILVTRQPTCPRHEAAVSQYFDTHSSVRDHDYYFSNFSIAWQITLSSNYSAAVDLWHRTIEAALKWEVGHKPRKVHKGTPLYFLGVTHVLALNLERGFLAMHRALDEDSRTRNSFTPNTPAYAFVTINSRKSGQFFRLWVRELANYVRNKLANFRRTRQGSLSVTLFRRRFLRQPALREEAFYFAALSAKVREFENGPIRLEGESQ